MACHRSAPTTIRRMRPCWPSIASWATILNRAAFASLAGLYLHNHRKDLDMSGSPTSFSGNLERFSGFAALYDRYRPQAPVVLVDILTQLAHASPPKLVVDIGSGTGISTVLWGDRAEAIIGIEPNADMRAQAEAQLAARP